MAMCIGRTVDHPKGFFMKLNGLSRSGGTDCTRRSAITLGILAALTLVSPLRAADPKPDAALKNKNIEARVLLDDKIKADAALAADCLAEGRKWIDKNATDAAASRKED